VKILLKYGSLGVAVVIALLVAFYFLFPETVFKLAIDAQRHSANLVKKTVQVDDHSIVYLEGGKGETVLLLHGFGGNKDHWTAFAKFLKGYHLVIPDVPGFGESSQVPKDNYNIDSQVGRIARFVEVLKLDKFHMAGNSMGGALTAEYGAKHPEKILTLALLDTAGVPSEKKNEFIIQFEKGNNLLLSKDARDYNKLMAMLFVKKPVIPDAFRKILFNDWIAHGEFNKKIWDDLQLPKYSLSPVLHRIQAPVLILWGDKDKLIDVGGVTFLEKNLKNHRTIIMKDTGHCPMIERPEEAAKVYVSFLKEKR